MIKPDLQFMPQVLDGVQVQDWTDQSKSSTPNWKKTFPYGPGFVHKRTVMLEQEKDVLQTTVQVSSTGPEVIGYICKGQCSSNER